jgi:hypothetical protein
MSPVDPFGSLLRSRRAFLRKAVVVSGALLLGLSTLRAAAEEGALPVALQAELLVKLAGYDRSFLQRAGDRVRVGLLVKPNDGDSMRAAEQMQAALARVTTIAGLAHDETIIAYEKAAALPEICRSQRLAILFVTPGFRNDIEPIRAALDGVDVLTASGVPDYVKAGVVLGFDVANGRPQLLVHLGQAKRQNVVLRSDVLRLMKVYE